MIRRRLGQDCHSAYQHLVDAAAYLEEVQALLDVASRESATWAHADCASFGREARQLTNAIRSLAQEVHSLDRRLQDAPAAAAAAGGDRP